MRYRELFNEIGAVIQPIEQTWQMSDATNGLLRGNWEALRKALPYTDHFIPTGFAGVDRLIDAHSPVIRYTLKEGRQRDGDPFASPVTHVSPFTPEGSHITLPPPGAWSAPERYAATLMHEMGHWVSPHVHRVYALAKVPSESFPDIPLAASIYGFGVIPRLLEEVIAELTGYLTLNAAAPEIKINRSQAYIRGWFNNAAMLGFSATDQRKIFAIAADQAHDSAAYLLRPLNLSPLEN